MGKKHKKNKHSSDEIQNNENVIETTASAASDTNDSESDEIKKFNKRGLISKEFYEFEMNKLFLELVKFQYWVKQKGLRLIIIFEGRDAAGKGGVIKRITEPMNPRGCRVVALDKPSDRERTQWFFQRYVAHLPAAGEIVIFDRSWYNRAGVERVMNYCTNEEYEEFMRSCPEFERMLVRSGIKVIKYWFSVSDEEQEKRFRERATMLEKRWKLSPMDLASWDKWEDYSKAKDELFKYTDIKQAPWFSIDANDKKRARLNCISHLLSTIPYEDAAPEPMELPERKIRSSYIRPPMEDINWVKGIY
ncbi:MAG: polyphosphate kinase 2 [Candidatus Kapabacteria bacterium]|nr:polyphosphate kinase 2 [Candidatus Kapabacteria bacterium]